MQVFDEIAAKNNFWSTKKKCLAPASAQNQHMMKNDEYHLKDAFGSFANNTTIERCKSNVLFLSFRLDRNLSRKDSRQAGVTD